MRALLEATGLRAPADLGQQLDFHLALWEANSVLALRSVPRFPVSDAGTRVTAEGPIDAVVRLVDGAVRVELTSRFPGSFDVELHWGGGQFTHRTTPTLDANRPHTLEVPLPEDRDTPPSPPTSIRLTRRPLA
jgi:hypothetical protein